MTTNFKVFKIVKEWKKTADGIEGLVTNATIHSEHNTFQKAVSEAKQQKTTGNFKKAGGETTYRYIPNNKIAEFFLKKTGEAHTLKVKKAQLAEKLYCQLANRLYDSSTMLFAGEVKTPLMKKLIKISTNF
jgi:hypothetical protein